MSRRELGFDVAADHRTRRAVAGVDEAGRGPLAGPVVAAAVVLDPARPIDGIGDSKQIPAPRREQLAAAIRERAVAWCVGRAGVEEIDRINILRASLVAMRRAVDGLGVDVTVAYVDGNIVPSLPCPAVAVVGGDASMPAIGAASILAKVARDAEMTAAAERYPGYDFHRHKGYATAAHLDALRRLGPSPIHRRSFAPMRLGAREPAQLDLPAAAPERSGAFAGALR